jgi:LacI family transcriptional regulator
VATLKDVAAAAGVSVGTVSRILSPVGDIVVRPATRERVLATAAALEYRPNRMAAALRTRRSRVMAVFLPDPQNPGWAGMLGAIQEVAAEADHLLAIADVRGPSLGPAEFARYALEARVDGVLLATGLLDEELVSRLAGSGLPIIAVGSRYEALAGSVIMRDSWASGLAVAHLAEHGHERIAFVAGVVSTDIVRRRVSGYLDAMSERGLPVREDWVVRGEGTLDSSHEATKQVLATGGPERPTAIIAINLMSALGVRAAALDAGLALPDDLSLVTFDDHVVEDHFDPPLTAIRMPMAEMGAEAATMLLRAIEGTHMRHTVVRARPVLVRRESVAGPAEHTTRIGIR